MNHLEEDFVPKYFNHDEYYKTIFINNVVFGTVPIGNPHDVTINLLEHIKRADIILVENHVEFSRLITHLQQSPVLRHVFVKPRAIIYQYDLHSDNNRMNQIIDELVEKSQNNKILIVSDEGSSVFLEPGQMLRNRLDEKNISYSVIGGVVSAIQAVITSKYSKDLFVFGSSLPAIPDQNRKDLFEKILFLNKPVVFLLTARGAPDSIIALSKFFIDWHVDFSINLTMLSETHICGSFQDVLSYINTNEHLFRNEAEYKKFAVFLAPQNNISPHEGYVDPIQESDGGYQT